MALTAGLLAGVARAGDCDGDGADDRTQILADAGVDVNENGTLDACEMRRGDLDLNEQVDFGDAVLVMLDFGSTGPNPADLDGNGLVEFLDVAVMLMEYGPSPDALRPRTMLGDLLANRAHLDVVVIGDSNATYSDGQGSRGYAGGLVDELGGRGATMYATGLFATATSGTTPAYHRLGATGSGRGPEASVTVNDASTTGWRRGGLSLHSLAGDYLRSPARPIQMDSRVLDWAYLPFGSTVNNASTEWVALYPESVSGTELHSGVAGAYRVVVAWGTVGADAGREPLNLMLSETGSPTQFAEVPMDGSPGSSIFAWEMRFPARPGRGALRAQFAGGAGGTTGPVGVLLRSIYRTDRLPGYGVSVLQAWSGGTTTQIAESLTPSIGVTIDTIRTFLREVRERQIAAGGQGRVLVFLNMGVNNGTGEASAPARCPGDTASIIASVDSAWRSLGYPADDLAYIATASHDGGVSRYDPAATNAAMRGGLIGDPRIAVVDLDALAPLGFLTENALFPRRTSTPNAHLCSDGYRTVIGRAVDRVLQGLPGGGLDTSPDPQNARPRRTPRWNLDGPRHE